MACGEGGCVIQNYADVDPTGAAKDPACGHRSNQGHDGLDFRVEQIGAPVTAIAAGTVRAIRDGEPDGAGATTGKECGNGVVIDHAAGWSSQACHLQRGSVVVKQGQAVTAGQAVGKVGLSGNTQFPHVHLALRLNDVIMEPFGGGLLAEARCSATAAPGPHWSASARAQLAYRGAQLFSLGFTGKEPAANADPARLDPGVTSSSPALVFWTLAVGPQSGDITRVRVYKPGGALLAEAERVQSRDQAQAWVYAGKRMPQGGWPKGVYRGEAELLRGGKVIGQRSAELRIGQ